VTARAAIAGMPAPRAKGARLVAKAVAACPMAMGFQGTVWID